MIIWGRDDYASRLKAYFNMLEPEREFIYMPFSLQQEADGNFSFPSNDPRLAHVNQDEEVYVAVSAGRVEIAKEKLQQAGLYNLVFYDAEMDNRLKKLFFKKYFAIQGKSFALMDDEIYKDSPEKKKVNIFLAKSAVDKPIPNYPAKLPEIVIPIHVGAALTDVKIAEVTDNTGENISERNPRYSETTALYWMWKNADADYLGLCHYRRLWKNPERIAARLQRDDIDVVLPLPTWVEPSVAIGHLELCTPSVWQILLDVLEQRDPIYGKMAKEVFDGNVFYACNMFIAKRQVLHDLCEWMFPIVMEVENKVGDLPDKYLNRYCGFCTEQLITLYFLCNQNNYHIIHAEKIFIG